MSRLAWANLLGLLATVGIAVITGLQMFRKERGGVSSVQEVKLRGPLKGASVMGAENTLRREAERLLEAKLGVVDSGSRGELDDWGVSDVLDALGGILDCPMGSFDRDINYIAPHTLVLEDGTEIEIFDGDRLVLLDFTLEKAMKAQTDGGRRK